MIHVLKHTNTQNMYIHTNTLTIKNAGNDIKQLKFQYRSQTLNDPSLQQKLKFLAKVVMGLNFLLDLAN